VAGKPFRIALAGLGTVGVGVVKALHQNAGLIAARAGRPVEIAAVSARNKKKKRGVDLSGCTWVTDAKALAEIPGLDAVVELIGGAEGPAHDLVKASLKNGIPVVTANKALLAHHGYRLAKLAEDKGAALKYEAAVAGGIPVIKSLREGFAANNIKAVYGILNGTCNYILTEMRETGRDFADVLNDAQAKGYAEADPSFDIDGVDAAHKLCILSALAFGVRPDFKSLKISGIRHITARDILAAQELGFRIKLLGSARRTDKGIVQSVEPCLVPIASPMGAVEGVYNAVFVEGDFVGTGLSVGRGAGEGPTASAVVADLIDLARGFCVPAFGIPAASLKKGGWTDTGGIVSHFYLHVVVLDRPGVLADIAAIMRDHEVSIEAVLQRGRDPDKPVSVVITSHPAPQGRVEKAVAQIAKLRSVAGRPCLMRIENF
jgi:homoserine dehydrogenase